MFTWLVRYMCGLFNGAKIPTQVSGEEVVDMMKYIMLSHCLSMRSRRMGKYFEWKKWLYRGGSQAIEIHALSLQQIAGFCRSGNPIPALCT